MGGKFKTGRQWDQYLAKVDQEEAPEAPSSGVIGAIMEQSNDHEKLNDVAEKLAGPPREAAPPPEEGGSVH